MNKREDHFNSSIIFVGRQEEMMTGSNISPRKRSLEDLFRPPLDLMFHGTFQNVSCVFSWYTNIKVNLSSLSFKFIYCFIMHLFTNALYSKKSTIKNKLILCNTLSEIIQVFNIIKKNCYRA